MIISKSSLDALFTGFKASFQTGYGKVVSYRDLIAMTVKSDTREERYAWLGQFPKVTEWVGGRVIKNLEAFDYTIKNKDFESTVAIPRNNIEDDRLGVYSPLFSEMGRSAAVHPDEMIFGLLKAGFDATCYDGQNFFDEEHPLQIGDAAPVSVSNMQAGSGPAWYLLDTSRLVKPIVFQERRKYDFQAMTDPSAPNVFLNKEFVYGVDARVNVGFGLWQLAFGSKAALDKTNYETARAAMSALRGNEGNLLNIMPTTLVVPPALEAAARTLIMADQIEGSSNIWRGSAELIVTPLLAD